MLLFSSGTNFVYILLDLLAFLMALSIAMPFHEFAHAFAAKHEGDYTSVAYRRYTLAMHSHIDLKGFLMLLVFGFGWAKPVPVDERNFKRGKKSKFLVAIAGIVANLILGVIFTFIWVLIYKISPNFYSSNLYGELLYEFLYISILLNFSLVFFNILPIYPLDGFRIVQTFTKPGNKFIEFMSRYSFIIMLVLVLTSLYSIYFSYTVELLANGVVELFCWILGV